MEKLRTGLRKRVSPVKYLRKQINKMGQKGSTPLKGGPGYEKLALSPDAVDQGGQESDDDESFELMNLNDDHLDDQTQLLPEEGLDATDGAKDEVVVEDGHKKESFLAITVQIFMPFLVAGLGMVAAGLMLDYVQHWTVFETVTELFILVPALLGLKGNLEMTLASRLSTFANLGYLDSKDQAWRLIVSNLALVQCQAIVVGFLASVFAVITGWMLEGNLSYDHGLLLCASSIVTASVASFILGLVMVLVILGSRKCNVNPDNVATPIAASLGDLTTLVLLAWMSSLLWADLDRDKWLAPTIIGTYLVFVPLCIIVAKRCEHTEKVLYSGWSPVLMAMVISSLGGMMLDQAVLKFKGIAVFQPVMNGVGGNLVAVQASRLSTHLHSSATLGTLPEKDSKICWNPCNVLFGSDQHCQTSRILMCMVIPGHLIFVYAISFLEAGHTSPTPIFLTFYLLSAVLQVWILLHTAQWMIMWFWSLKIDPDNSAIPYLTALGDLLGGGLLWLAFECLYLIGDKDADLGD